MGNGNNSNITRREGEVTTKDRQKILNQRPITLWLTGLSAAGKSTLAYALERQLVEMGYLCYVLDGDNIRHGLNSNLGFSVVDRSENIRRVAEVARLMNDAGLIVITAFISPSRVDRERAKTIIGSEYFSEIFINSKLASCETRDPKGLYKLARSGRISEFTGVSAPYEVPMNPDFEIVSDGESVDRSLKKLVDFVLPFLAGCYDS